MGRGNVHGGEQKAFVKIFDGICQWNSRWDRWNDMINLFAIEIANTVDRTHAPGRNETYAAIAKKYKPQEFEGFARLLAELVTDLEKNSHERKVQKNPKRFAMELKARKLHPANWRRVLWGDLAKLYRNQRNIRRRRKGA